MARYTTDPKPWVSLRANQKQLNAIPAVLDGWGWEDDRDNVTTQPCSEQYGHVAAVGHTGTHNG